MVQEFCWLRVGHKFGDGSAVGRVVRSGPGYQVAVASDSTKNILLAEEGSIIYENLLQLSGDTQTMESLSGRTVAILICPASSEIVRVGDLSARQILLAHSELQSLSIALGKMQARMSDAGWEDALYVSHLDICLATKRQTGEDRRALAVRLMTGGVGDAGLSKVQIRALNPWLTEIDISEILNCFGISTHPPRASGSQSFDLPGRPQLESFFREEIIEYHKNYDRYLAMGVKPPRGILLCGPPGTGKTFAVRRLAEFLGWPIHEVGMGQLGSPYIHQTSVKMRQVFERAISQAPSIVLMDEVDALVNTRTANLSEHKIEEITEMLKHLESAPDKGVLVLATTNRKEAIDDAFLRKGRFDHVLNVDYPSAVEIAGVLEAELAKRPHVGGLSVGAAAEKLSGRPLSDVGWAINEAARLAVRSGKSSIDDICLFTALAKLPALRN